VKGVKERRRPETSLTKISDPWFAQAARIVRDFFVSKNRGKYVKNPASGGIACEVCRRDER